MGKVVHLDETFEYPVHLIRCNAHTRIGDVECYILAFLVIPVTDVPGGGELEGIAYQIGNDLENPVLVSVNHDILVRGFVYQLHSFGTAENMCVVYLLAEWMEAYGRDGELHDARFYF